MNFSVEEENLICMYHTSDRRRTMVRMLAALPDMDTEVRLLAPRWRTSTARSTWTIRQISRDTRCLFRM